MFFETLALISAVDHKLAALPSRAVQAEVVVNEVKAVNGLNELQKMAQSMRYEECKDEAAIAKTRTKWARTFFEGNAEVLAQAEAAEMALAEALAGAA